MVDFKEVALPLAYKTRNRLVCGLGINDAWYITERKEEGVIVKCPYSVKWKCMLTQVGKLVKRNGLPATEFICEDWLKFSNFRFWMEQQDWKGYHSTVEAAFLKYKEFKESVVKEAATKWKDQIDPRAYKALIEYQVEVTD